MFYSRISEEELQKNFFKGKILMILGPRQVGKTTLCEKLISQKNLKVKSFNGDNASDVEQLNHNELEFLKLLVADFDIIFIDEGQKISQIGNTLKLLVDHYKKKKQIIITGSSSVNLLDNTAEPLTGRKRLFELLPLSLKEIYQEKDFGLILKNLENHLIFGAYPEVVNQKTFKNKKIALDEIVSSYLYKDILQFQKIKNSDVILKLLRALALQIGAEVSYTELSNLVGIDKNTVESYVDLLEKSFVIFRLPPYYSFHQKRKEISKLRKIFFYDLGIRNSLINNLNPVDSRNDVGNLWENFLITERIKYQNYSGLGANNHFWRTYDGAEVDWVEEREGKIFGYEFKWNKKKTKKFPPKSWQEKIKGDFESITPDNFLDFIW